MPEKAIDQDAESLHRVQSEQLQSLGGRLKDQLGLHGGGPAAFGDGNVHVGRHEAAALGQRDALAGLFCHLSCRLGIGQAVQARIEGAGLAEDALDKAADGLCVVALAQLAVNDDAGAGQLNCPGAGGCPVVGRIGHPLLVALHVLRLQSERGCLLQRQDGGDVDERIAVDAGVNADDEDGGGFECAGRNFQGHAMAQVLSQRLGGVIEQVAQVAARVQAGGPDGVQAAGGWRGLAGAVAQLLAQGAIQGATVQRVAQGHVLTGPQGAFVALIRRRRGCGPAVGCRCCGPEAQQRQQQRGGPGSQPHGLTGTAGARCARGASRASGPDRIPAARAASRTTGPDGRRARGAAS